MRLGQVIHDGYHSHCDNATLSLGGVLRSSVRFKRLSAFLSCYLNWMLVGPVHVEESKYWTYIRNLYNEEMKVHRLRIPASTVIVNLRLV